MNHTNSSNQQKRKNNSRWDVPPEVQMDKQKKEMPVQCPRNAPRNSSTQGILGPPPGEFFDIPPNSYMDFNFPKQAAYPAAARPRFWSPEMRWRPPPGNNCPPWRGPSPVPRGGNNWAQLRFRFPPPPLPGVGTFRPRSNVLIREARPQLNVHNVPTRADNSSSEVDIEDFRSSIARKADLSTPSSTDNVDAKTKSTLEFSAKASQIIDCVLLGKSPKTAEKKPDPNTSSKVPDESGSKSPARMRSNCTQRTKESHQTPKPLRQKSDQTSDSTRETSVKSRNVLNKHLTKRPQAAESPKKGSFSPTSPSKNIPMGKDELKKLVTAPRSRKEQHLLDTMLKNYSRSKHVSRLKPSTEEEQLQNPSDQPVTIKDLEDLPDDVQMQIVQLLHEETEPRSSDSEPEVIDGTPQCDKDPDDNVVCLDSDDLEEVMALNDEISQRGGEKSPKAQAIERHVPEPADPIDTTVHTTLGLPSMEPHHGSKQTRRDKMESQVRLRRFGCRGLADPCLCGESGTLQRFTQFCVHNSRDRPVRKETGDMMSLLFFLKEEKFCDVQLPLAKRPRTDSNTGQSPEEEQRRPSVFHAARTDESRRSNDARFQTENQGASYTRTISNGLHQYEI